ncbi:MAG: ParB/RepB/Spo0J family partition protein [bacterium]|nr:ParB/RepB/Spo0J family partition protein [bacterium]
METVSYNEIVAVKDILLSKQGPREFFGQGELEDLARSLQNKGVLCPLLVKPHPKLADKYLLIAGERRHKAALIAGLLNVPVCVLTASDRECVEISLVENIHHKDLAPIEEARAFRFWLNTNRVAIKLPDEFKSFEDYLSHKISKSITYIKDRLDLLKMPNKVQELVGRGDLSVTKAKVVNMFDTANDKIEAAKIAAAMPHISEKRLKEQVLAGHHRIWEAKVKGVPLYQHSAQAKIAKFLKDLKSIEQRTNQSSGYQWSSIKEYLNPSAWFDFRLRLFNLVTDLGYILYDAIKDSRRFDPAVNAECDYSFAEFVCDIEELFPEAVEKERERRRQGAKLTK